MSVSVAWLPTLGRLCQWPSVKLKHSFTFTSCGMIFSHWGELSSDDVSRQAGLSPGPVPRLRCLCCSRRLQYTISVKIFDERCVLVTTVLVLGISIFSLSWTWQEPEDQEFMDLNIGRLILSSSIRRMMEEIDNSFADTRLRRLHACTILRSAEFFGTLCRHDATLRLYLKTGRFPGQDSWNLHVQRMEDVIDVQEYLSELWDNMG